MHLHKIFYALLILFDIHDIFYNGNEDINKYMTKDFINFIINRYDHRNIIIAMHYSNVDLHVWKLFAKRAFSSYKSVFLMILFSSKKIYFLMDKVFLKLIF